jgi:hypothetical protein
MKTWRSEMRKYSKFIVAAGAIAALAVPSAALANSSNMQSDMSSDAGVTGTFVKGTSQGNNNGVTQYRAAYNDGFQGPVSCTGTHHAATAKAAAFDSFTCTSTTGSPLGFYTPNESLSMSTLPAGNGWWSDFDGALAKTFTGTVSADGMSYTAVATY